MTIPKLTFPQACALRRHALDAQAKAYHDAPLVRAMEIEALKALEELKKNPT